MQHGPNMMKRGKPLWQTCISLAIRWQHGHARKCASGALNHLLMHSTQLLQILMATSMRCPQSVHIVGRPCLLAGWTQWQVRPVCAAPTTAGHSQARVSSRTCPRSPMGAFPSGRCRSPLSSWQRAIWCGCGGATHACPPLHAHLSRALRRTRTRCAARFACRCAVHAACCYTQR